MFLGIDVGGSGIKACLVDVVAGKPVGERVRITTPQPSTPQAVAAAVAELKTQFDEYAGIGIGFPAVVDAEGLIHTAMNIDKTWMDVNGAELFASALGRKISILNDADAAAMAELEFGAASGVSGTVLVLTFGTGIGSGLIVDGALARNVELGVIELDGHIPAENYFSSKVRRAEDLDWPTWVERANRYLSHVDRVMAPDLIVFGGGITKHWDKFSEYFDPDLPLVPAASGNNAGLIGAALVASRERTG